MDEFDYHEELSFGKIGENKSGIKFQNNYVLFHQIFGSKFLMNPGKVLVGIGYDYLCGYLEGASIGKSNKEFYIWNGISNITRNGCYPNVEFLPLEKGELEKLLIDTNLTKRFEKHIKIVR